MCYFFFNILYFYAASLHPLLLSFSLSLSWRVSLFSWVFSSGGATLGSSEGTTTQKKGEEMAAPPPSPPPFPPPPSSASLLNFFLVLELLDCRIE